MIQSKKFQLGEFGQEIDELESKRQVLKRKSTWVFVAFLIVGVYNLRSYEQYGVRLSTYFLSMIGLMILTTTLYLFWKELKVDKMLNQKHFERIDALFRK